MHVRWKNLCFIAILVLGISALEMTRTATTSASPQRTPVSAAAPSSAKVAKAGALGPSIPDTTLAINSDKPMSQRVVHYEIDAKYDASRHTVDATETLTYHNLTGQALDHFPFHLYLNGFQPKATWVREAKQTVNRESYDTWDEKETGSEEVKSFETVGQGDLTAKLQYIQPDDGNKDDKTVFDVHLPKAIAPGAYVQFKIAFHDQMPETQARTGWKRDFVVGGQWFPKVGVWWQGAWNCHQFHAMTEFFADFGVYDVKLTVPQNEIVGATGIKVEEVSNADNTKTVTYHADDVHDFAWTASPRYRVKDDGVFQGQMGPVRLQIMMQPAHWKQVERHEWILRETLNRFEKWYGPYPYKTLTLVDPEPGSAAGGMEYPTFITGGTSWFAPKGFYDVESVVEHEFGHQYWYGMVATNEFEDAWLDEGINSYTEVKVLGSILGPDKSFFNIAGATAGDGPLHRFFFLGVYDLDPMAQKGYEYASFSSYGGITYGKTAEVLETLEGIVGEDVMQRAMHTYFMKYRFTHPTKEDFLKTIEEVSGKDLRWYFNQAVYGTQVLDYEVMRLDSFPLNWYEKKEGFQGFGKNEDKDTVYRSTVWLHRKDDFVMPVSVEIRFDNGEMVREHWDGQSRWTKFSYDKRAKVVSAELDPDHKLQLDRNNFNNSELVEPNRKPGTKVTNYWMFVTQWVSQALAWWAV
jgi:peptidase M1-like protein